MDKVKAVVVVTGNGGGVLSVRAVEIPRDIWEDGEAREYIDDNREDLGLVTLGDLEGYEVMSTQDAVELAGKLNAAAGEPGPGQGLLGQALEALNTAPRFNVGKTTSYRIAADIERFLRDGKGGV